MVLVAMTSGSIFAQQLISEVERDSIVSKIVRGNECAEKLILANDVILQGDKVISTQKNIISLKDTIIYKYQKQIAFYKDNEIKYDNIIKNDNGILKQYKKKNIGWAIKGIAIGIVTGIIIMR